MRQEALLATYGFKCQCPGCRSDVWMTGAIPPAPSNASTYSLLHVALVSHVFGNLDHGFPIAPSLPLSSKRDLPPNLMVLLNQSHVPYLSTQFSDASHDANYPLAFTSGLALLAMYILIYPTNYPLIGELCASLFWSGLMTGAIS